MISPEGLSLVLAPTPGVLASLVPHRGHVSAVEWRAAEYVRVAHVGQTT